MPHVPGFKSETQRDRFHRNGALYKRGAPLARECGAKMRTGGKCTQLALAGETRCLRHGGPDAARRFRSRQRAGLETGSVSPDEWARAEERRARNRLQWAWTRDPRLPGRTIDLGVADGEFREAAQALGVDLDRLYPAVADWLRWRWQRTQRDRTDAAAWRRAVLTDLPQRKAAAEAVAVLADLGVRDGRTRAARAIKAALRAGGVERARRVAEAFREAEILSGSPTGGQGCTDKTALFTSACVKPWTARVDIEGWKRRLPDSPRPAPAPPKVRRPVGRPRRVPDAPETISTLAEVLWRADPPVRDMFARLRGQQDQLTFLRDLAEVLRAPDDARARMRWMGWVATVGGNRDALRQAPDEAHVREGFLD